MISFEKGSKKVSLNCSDYLKSSSIFAPKYPSVMHVKIMNVKCHAF